MNFDIIPTKLDVSLYGNLESVSSTLSKCRVRIFYKYMNRNRTFISDDFANQLIESLPYTPIKGIFSKEDVDFQDHGEDNTDGRIYGIVPAEPNFKWEKHKDVDNIERDYACCDVLLFTGLYPEAKLIPEESQSMEIFRNNLKGEWRISQEDGDPYYYFMQGCLVGLQVLGNEVEPCFEGAAFYTLNKQVLTELLSYVKNNKKEERKEMEKSLFRLSDNEKYCKLCELCNPNFNEEGNWQQERIVLDVYDDYCICLNTGSFEYERVYYTKENDNISIGDIVGVKMIDATADEYAALESLKTIGAGSYSSVETSYNEMKEKVSTLENEKAESETNYTNQKTEFETKIQELENQVTDLTNTNTDFNSKIEKYEAEKLEREKELSDIKTENESLTAFKKNIELEQKQGILTKYEDYLSESQIASFKEAIENFSVADFKKEVSAATVDSVISNNKHNEPDMFFKGGKIDERDRIESPVLRMLNNYKNGGNK